MATSNLNRKTNVSRNATVKDTIALIIKTSWKEADSPAVLDILSRVDDPNPKLFLKNLFAFVVRNIEYVEDPDDIENVSTPRRLLADAQGDCKKMTVLIASVILAKGWNPLFRVVSYDGVKYTHIYPIVPNTQGQYITMDVVNNEKFNKEVNHMTNVTYDKTGQLVNMELNLLSGKHKDGPNPPYGDYYGSRGNTMVNAGNYPGNQMMNFGTTLSRLDEDLNGIIGRNQMAGLFDFGLLGWERWVKADQGQLLIYGMVAYLMDWGAVHQSGRSGKPSSGDFGPLLPKWIETQRWFISNTKASYGDFDARWLKCKNGLYNGFKADTGFSPIEMINTLFMVFLTTGTVTPDMNDPNVEKLVKDGVKAISNVLPGVGDAVKGIEKFAKSIKKFVAGFIGPGFPPKEVTWTYADLQTLFANYAIKIGTYFPGAPGKPEDYPNKNPFRKPGTPPSSSPLAYYTGPGRVTIVPGGVRPRRPRPTTGIANQDKIILGVAGAALLIGIIAATRGKKTRKR